MPTETAASSNSTMLAASKSFIVAHPVGVAIIGGIVVGVAAYYTMKLFSRKKEEPAAA